MTLRLARETAVGDDYAGESAKRRAEASRMAATVSAHIENEAGEMQAEASSLMRRDV